MKSICLLLLILTIIISVFFGSSNTHLFSLNIIDTVVLNYRLPRVLFSALIGGCLGFSGSIYQLILKNPLADSFTTGASGVAALGAVISLVLGFNFYLTPLIAFIFAIFGIAFIYKLSSINGYINPVTMILSGIVLSIFASSLTGFLKYFFDESLGNIIFFLMGGLHFVSWTQLIFFMLFFIMLFLIQLKDHYSLDILSLDEATAITTGVNVKAVRMKAFVIATLLISLCVSFTGIIGFIGLIVPHISRDLFGSAMYNNLIYSTIFGGILLTISDTMSRIIIPSGAELPVGIITSLLGGIFFFYLLTRKRAVTWF